MVIVLAAGTAGAVVAAGAAGAVVAVGVLLQLARAMDAISKHATKMYSFVPLYCFISVLSHSSFLKPFDGYDFLK
jgi:hypothetical protein